MDSGVILKVMVGVAALFLTVISWVWAVASKAKQTACDAQTDVAKQEVLINSLDRQLAQLHEDQQAGFAAMNGRLDRMMES